MRPPLATALLPPGGVVWAFRSRRTFILDTGIVLPALSLATLRHYVRVARCGSCQFTC